jgi:hypothetical protein
MDMDAKTYILVIDMFSQLDRANVISIVLENQQSEKCAF